MTETRHIKLHVQSILCNLLRYSDVYVDRSYSFFSKALPFYFYRRQEGQGQMDLPCLGFE